jgi:DNA-directed RNA polymerase subunit beta'
MWREDLPLIELNNFEALQIGLASPEQIRDGQEEK